MIPRTLQLIQGVAAGSYISPDDKRYDDAEIQELANVLNQLVYAPSQIRARLQSLGVNVVPSNFYSEVPSVEEIEDSAGHALRLDGIFDDEVLRSTLSRLEPYAAEFSPPRDRSEGGGFAWNNGAFSYSDAMAYYCFIRDRKPARVVEIGSGWSSLIAAEALKQNGRGALTCIDPYPSPVLDSIKGGIELVPVMAQHLTEAFLNERLGPEDILFIDSTHTVKHNSDCIHIYLRLLPKLAKNVLVHAHDIRLPHPLSVSMMRDSQIYWTEQYLLYAYLLDNVRCQVVFSSTYMHDAMNDELSGLMGGKYGAGGASLWFSQASRPDSTHEIGVSSFQDALQVGTDDRSRA